MTLRNRALFAQVLRAGERMAGSSTGHWESTGSLGKRRGVSLGKKGERATLKPSCFLHGFAED